MTAIRCFTLLAPTALAGIVVGNALCSMLEIALPTPALALIAASVLSSVGIGTMMLQRLVITPHVHATQAATAGEVAAAARLQAHRRLRHEIRGALSPALLTADQLLSNTDPCVQQASETIVRAVERAADLLLDPFPDAILHGHS